MVTFHTTIATPTAMILGANVLHADAIYDSSGECQSRFVSNQIHSIQYTTNRFDSPSKQIKFIHLT